MRLPAAFRIENPQSVQLRHLKGEQVIGEDPRELGIKVQRIAFCGPDKLQYSVFKVLDFTEKGGGHVPYGRELDTT